MAKTGKRIDPKDRFEMVAQRLGCDEDKERFEAKLKKLAKVKPLPKRKGR